jgi:hypothetical protein
MLKMAVRRMVQWSDVYRGLIVHCTKDTFTHQSKSFFVEIVIVVLESV